MHALYGRGRILPVWDAVAILLVNEIPKRLTTFGRNLSRLRSQAGISQEKLAEQVDVHPRYIQKLEAGTGHPSLMVLIRLRKALNCEWNQLLEKL